MGAVAVVVLTVVIAVNIMVILAMAIITIDLRTVVCQIGCHSRIVSGHHH